MAPCGGANICFAVLDPVSVKPLYCNFVSPGLGTYNSVYCKGSLRPYAQFDFSANNATWRQRINDFIDSIPNGHYVMAFTYFQESYIDLDAALYPAFYKMGCSTNITSITSKQPFAFFGTKGAMQGTAVEVVGADSASTIQLTSPPLTTNWTRGFVESEVIGPAYSWDSLFWRQRPYETPNEDTVTLSVIGIKKDGSEVVLVSNLPPDSADISLQPYADASVYPYLKLVANVKDTVNYTPSQLIRWQVIYAPVPEAAVNQLAGAGFSFYNDTLYEGETVKMIYPVQNISEYVFPDSMLIISWVQDNKGTVHPLSPKLKKAGLAPGEVIMDTVEVNTFGYPGLNTLWAEVNPLGYVHSQNEQYHFNNLASVSFRVDRDRINPLLDVTFDGIHILNGDIVSAKPSILVQLKDENKYLALNSSSDFQVFLKKPSQPTAQPIAFGSEMTFTPAVLPNNSCKINYTPTFTEDGVYELTVQAADRSGNESGSNDYKIKFEVITRSTITNVMNYPNPFSTSTRFVFTLTGAEIPQYMKIQVLTITGKVVREITIDELGPIHIGRNITQYAWDGKDQFGDQLANGVYLYRVQTQLNGSAIEKRASGADQHFNKEYGKMYLMR